MKALEFLTKIEHGTIKLPSKYQNEYENVHARIIVLFEKSESTISQKNKLKSVFSKMKNMDMFSKIENPTSWQKQLRDEWE